MFGQRKRQQNIERLELWKKRYADAHSAYQGELTKMERREALYQGTKAIKAAASAKGEARPAATVRNIVAELVESQVSSSIPQPKVTALRPQDEGKARLIEDMLRNELDRLPIEYANDMEERTVPIQGGALTMVEWDSTKRTRTTTGELALEQLHPRKVIPQDGIYDDIESMDYIFVLVPQTKAYIKRRYGVEVEDEREEAPEARGDTEDAANEIFTQYYAYYRNTAGGIGLFSWVCETVLVDLEDYQARRRYICKKCGQQGDGTVCAYCGSTHFDEGVDEGEILAEDIVREDGTVIPAFSPITGENGAPLFWDGNELYGQTPMEGPTQIPLYKPNIFPIVLRKNVSVFGRFLGDSDVDKIEDQQESIKKLETIILEKLTKGGSVLTIPHEAVIDFTDEQLRVMRLKNPADKAMMDVFNLQPDISGDLAYMNLAYEEARQIIGITDSFQGRQDRTATSGVAKEFAARQSAGRLESKRAMKDAYYARLFEVMFKFILAYADEPRTVVSTDNQGHTKYSQFNRWDFLEQDESGAWYWNDRFLFSVDASATLANNREAMWQECRMNFQQGAYGNPTELETLVVFWTRMERLHYPGASDTRDYLEEKLKAQQAAAAAAPVPADNGVPQEMPGSMNGLEAVSEGTAAEIAASDAQAEQMAALVNGGGRL